MASVNKVMIMGRLGQDPELKYTQNQVPVVTLNVATSEYKTGQDGQRQELTEWHRVIAWQKTAENCNKYLTKGRGVFIEGRLQTRKWQDKNGSDRYTTEIVAQSVQFLPDSKGEGNQAQRGSQASNTGGAFPENTGTNNPPSDLPASMDDIPF